MTKPRVFLPSALILCFMVSCQQEEAVEKSASGTSLPPIIDVHMHAYLERLVNAGFGERIMFGSDQMYWPEAIGLAIEGVESADFLTEEQKRDIFFNNAVRFFQLDEHSLNQ